MTYLKMLTGIKSLNIKQCPARLSPPRVKLSSFIGGKFPTKKGQNNLWLLLIFVLVIQGTLWFKIQEYKLQYTPNFWDWVLFKI